MINFYKRALEKIEKLEIEQLRELLVDAVDELSILETVLDSIQAGILVCNDEDKIIMINKYAQRLLSIKYTEGVQILSAIKDERILKFIKESLAGRDRIIDKEITIEHNDRNKMLLFNIDPLVQDRRITGSLIFIEDITEKRKGEARLRRAESLASLTTLAAGVAHEIKNPLGSISIHLQLLQKTLAKKLKSKDITTDKYFNVLKEEVERLNRIVVDFLFAVRPMALELREGDINKLLSQIVDFVHYEMEQSNIHCLLELEDDLPPVLYDDRYMKQALLNLVKNSHEAMPKGGLLTVATKRIDDEIRISICDTGIGISEANMVKIFEPYYTTKETGTGLGLTQVFKIIREHQGEISVDSVPGAGSDFRILLPIPQKETRMIGYNETGAQK